MWYNVFMLVFRTYLTRRRTILTMMLKVLEHGAVHNADEIEKHRLLIDQLNDIIHDFDEIVKTDVENSK